VRAISPPSSLRPLVIGEFTRGRQLHRGNARANSLGTDFSSAFLHAGLSLGHPDSRCTLQVTSNPEQGWTTIYENDTTNPYRGPLSISQWVRGRRTIYVKARLSGRDDGHESCLAQFLRTLIDPGHLQLHDRFVFELRVSPRELPLLKVAMNYDESGWGTIPVDSNGTFLLMRSFARAGLHRDGMRALVNDVVRVLETRLVWVTTPGCVIDAEPSRPEIKLGELYRAEQPGTRGCVARGVPRRGLSGTRLPRALAPFRSAQFGALLSP
jgi:hypothetical protein